MSENNTHETPDARPFEERILTRLDSMDSRLSALEDKVERRLQDTRPMWEAVLSRLDDLQKEMRTGFRTLGRKIDILNKDFLTMRGDIEDLDERVTKLEESRS
ncbi:MAG TPA: hypothetical protein VEQ42_09105 [Pyrinomonadaceae bacterium]|nr:hypothetical protein [Pyrinomonadaceae bacterium]